MNNRRNVPTGKSHSASYSQNGEAYKPEPQISGKLQACSCRPPVFTRETPDFIAPHLWPPNSPDLNPVDYCIGVHCNRACTQPQYEIWSIESSALQMNEQIRSGHNRQSCEWVAFATASMRSPLLVVTLSTSFIKHDVSRTQKRFFSEPPKNKEKFCYFSNFYNVICLSHIGNGKKWDRKSVV